MNRIIFLDIDGPMIPSSMYFIDRNASWNRTISPVGVAIVNRLVEESGAKIVTNSSHNNLVIESTGADLRADLIRAGIPEASFHEDWRTKYPFVGRLTEDDSNRMVAIREWMQRNGEADWIAFDDVKFTTDNRLILVDFDSGITTREFNKAADLWKLGGVLIL